MTSTDNPSDFYDAYYAKDAQEVLAFCERYGITHILVDEQQFSKDYLQRGHFYFQPFDAYIQKKVSQTSSFAVMRLPREAVVYRGGAFFIVDYQKLKSSNIRL